MFSVLKGWEVGRMGRKEEGGRWMGNGMEGGKGNGKWRELWLYLGGGEQQNPFFCRGRFKGMLDGWMLVTLLAFNMSGGPRSTGNWSTYMALHFHAWASDTLIVFFLYFQCCSELTSTTFAMDFQESFEAGFQYGGLILGIQRVIHAYLYSDLIRKLRKDKSQFTHLPNSSYIQID